MLNAIFTKKIVHLCVFNRNVGDNALNLVIHEKLREISKVSQVELLNTTFTKRLNRKLQKSSLVVLGGGGLIHSYGPRGNPLELTGTLWQIKLSDLLGINPKIVLYGVGFNQFYGEQSPLMVMKDFFDILVDKNALITFRNDGSKERLTKYFPEFDRYIKVIPDPGLFYRPKPTMTDYPYVLLQIAADRPQLRYGNRFDDFIKMIKYICENIDLPVMLIPHTPDDVELYRKLNNLNAEILPLKNKVKKTAEVVGYYAGAHFTISTRGHSQILSIGNCVPSFSIATHPKVVGFAEACDVSQFCFNLHQEPIDKGIERFHEFLKNLDLIRNHLVQINKRFDMEFAKFNDEVRSLLA